MDLTLLSRQDFELVKLSTQFDKQGKLARTEMKRRKMVGYCDGSALQRVDPMQEMTGVDA
jgi:hypothetical protein|tara:strand:+ start:281 stop:460 length:180 start_codon:yes stop_codon:yes gene_type:complete